MRGRQAQRLPGGHRLGLALQLERAELLVAHRSAGGAHGPLAHRHAPGAGGALEPGRHVHGVAGDRVALADGARHHLAGVDAHPQLEVHARRQALVDLGHRRLHPERRAHGALLVVLVRHRRAEERHHVVPDVLVHVAAVALHLGAEAHQGAVHEPLHGLRVHPLGHRGVARQVGEQDRHLAALLRQGARPARTGAGAGVPSSAAPQFMQKRAAAGAGVAQAGQTALQRVPQPMQKRASAGFSVPQAAQASALML